jgi:phthiocerol/phenolphthiocerol synthesis type-I polyketide synthase E
VDLSFRTEVDKGLALLPSELAQEIRRAICGNRAEAGELSVLPTSTAQPLLFLVEHTLAMRWIDIGVEPSLLLGHSLGELTAAAVAGVFSFEDGLKLAAARGQLMQEMAEGAMLAVSLPVEEASRYLSGDLWVAAENSPKLTIVSGTPTAVQKLQDRLTAAKIATVRLPTDRAFHSPHMAEASARFHDVVASVERCAPSIPWLSNVSGTWITPQEAMSPEYWAEQMTSRIRFAENAALLANDRYFLLEVGPGDALANLVRHHDRSLSSASSLGGPNRPTISGRLWRPQHAFGSLALACVGRGCRSVRPAGRARSLCLPIHSNASAIGLKERRVSEQQDLKVRTRMFRAIRPSVAMWVPGFTCPPGSAHRRQRR